MDRRKTAMADESNLRNSERRLAREELAWELRTVRGLTFRQVAEAVAAAGLGPCGPGDARGLVDAVYDRTDELLAQAAVRDRLMQAARYEFIYGEAIRQFLASKSGVNLARQREIELPDDVAPPPGQAARVADQLRQLIVRRKEKLQEVRESHGDARFLAVALQALAQRARLLGSDRPLVLESDPSEMIRARERAERLARINALSPERLSQLAEMGRELGLGDGAEF
jgi:hypothetical protein